jgi:hypothetical protein
VRPRFQADADLTQKIVSGVRRREPSVDSQDAHQGGLIGLPDHEVLKLASESGRILVTHDRKTMPAHWARSLATRSSPGLVVIGQDLDVGAAIEYLVLIWAASEAEEWHNTIIFVPL